MILYDYNEIFKVNDNLEFDLIEEEWGNYVRVKNFWKYPDKISEIILNTPCVKLPAAIYHKNNGEKYFDGRSHFVFPTNMLFSDVTKHLISENFKIDKKFLKLKWSSPTILFNNVFEILDDTFNNYEEYAYAPHRDGIDQIACIWYMNQTYIEGDGTALYDISISETEECKMNLLNSPWSKEPKKIGLIPAEYNSLVIYEGNIPHAQSITKHWHSEKRMTMVQFYNDTRVYKV